MVEVEAYVLPETPIHATFRSIERDLLDAARECAKKGLWREASELQKCRVEVIAIADAYRRQVRQ